MNLGAVEHGSIVVDGGVPIRDLNRALDWQLPDEEAALALDEVHEGEHPCVNAVE